MECLPWLRWRALWWLIEADPIRRLPAKPLRAYGPCRRQVSVVSQLGRWAVVVVEMVVPVVPLGGGAGGGGDGVGGGGGE